MYGSIGISISKEILCWRWLLICDAMRCDVVTVSHWMGTPLTHLNATHCTCAAITMIAWFCFTIHTLFLNISTTFPSNLVVTQSFSNELSLLLLIEAKSLTLLKRNWLFFNRIVYFSSHWINRFLFRFVPFRRDGILLYFIFMIESSSIRKRNQNALLKKNIVINFSKSALFL